MKVTDIEGKVAFEIGTSEDDINGKKKELKEAFQTALKAYNELSADEQKNAKKPLMPAVKKVKTVDDLTVAAKMAMDLQKEHDEQQKKKGEEEAKKGEKEDKKTE